MMNPLPEVGSQELEAGGMPPIELNRISMELLHSRQELLEEGTFSTNMLSLRDKDAMHDQPPQQRRSRVAGRSKAAPWIAGCIAPFL